MMDYQIETFEKHNDVRGQLVVFLKESALPNSKKKFGQIYFVTFEKKGAIRGNHYHKQWEEWFGVVAGRVKVYLEDVRTKEKINFILDSKGQKYKRLRIGPYMAHAIKSLTSYAAFLNYANSEWSHKDSFHYQIV